MSNSTLKKIIFAQFGISIYLCSTLSTTHAAYFERPLDMSKLCSAPICAQSVERTPIDKDVMVVSMVAGK